MRSPIFTIATNVARAVYLAYRNKPDRRNRYVDALLDKAAPKVAHAQPAPAPQLSAVQQAIVDRHSEDGGGKAAAKIPSADIWKRTVDQINKLVRDL